MVFVFFEMFFSRLQVWDLARCSCASLVSPCAGLYVGQNVGHGRRASFPVTIVAAGGLGGFTSFI